MTPILIFVLAISSFMLGYSVRNRQTDKGGK